MIIYPQSSRFEINIGEVTFVISPLSYQHKGHVSSFFAKKNGINFEDQINAAFYSIKYALKDIKGVKNADNSEYKLVFEGDSITDECANEVLQLAESQDLIVATAKMIEGIPALKKLKGIKVKFPGQADLPSKKKKS